MKKAITKLLISIFCFLGYTNANAEPQKPIITVLHAGTKSNTGMEFSYPTDGKAKLIFAQGIFPIGAVLPMHTHPSPVVVHVLQGELTSVRPNGESTTYNAGDSFIEAPNSPHKVTNTGKRPAIIYGVFTTVEGHGPLTIFK